MPVLSARLCAYLSEELRMRTQGRTSSGETVRRFGNAALAVRDVPSAASSAIRPVVRILAQTHFSIPINERVCHLEFFLYFIRTAAQFLLIVIEIAMFVRAVISFVPSLQGGIFDQFSYAMSEPFIVPMRILLDRFESVRNLPVDVPFFITFLLISVIQTLLT